MLCETEQVADLCWHEAVAEHAERRRQRRKPFLRRGLIVLAEGRRANLPAFCRDISPGGIGLLHATPLEVGSSFTLQIPLLGRVLELQCDTTWCLRVSHHDYFSGSIYRCATMPQSLVLLSAVLSDDLHRRLQRRFPFARPVTLVNAQGAPRPGFTRDISRSGIGLIHQQPIELGDWVVNIPTRSSGKVAARVQIRRCDAISHGWYASGGSFAPPATEAMVTAGQPTQLFATPFTTGELPSSGQAVGR